MNKTIQIAGDVAIDHLYHIIPQKDEGNNWQLYPSLQTTLLPGGAFILTRFVQEAVKATGLTAEIEGQRFPDDPEGPEARKMIQSKVWLAKYEEEDKKSGKPAIFRVEKFHGYSTPQGTKPVMPPLEKDSGTADLLILDDAGNGFREQENNFPKAVQNENTLVVYKMSRPLAKGKLWEKVSVGKKDWVLVLRANDLRLCSNVNVSKALSWERTAMEMAFGLKRNPSLLELQKAPYLVVLFGTDGALLVSNNQDEKPLLIFDPENLEGGFTSSVKRESLSTGSAFIASFSTALLQDGMEGLVNGIKCGLSSMRNLVRQGFHVTENHVQYPFAPIFGGEKYHFSECSLEVSIDLNSADPDYWRILDEKTRLSKPLATEEIVRKKKPGILGEIPVGIYGKLQTFDRSEVEQFNAIKNLILEYLDDPKTSRPLCIAVFGPPGAGKSFGVKQVLGSLGRGEIPTMTFNISQYASYDDLVADFHKIRDKVLTGAVPVAFFDEFDSDRDHHPLGWLKYFLSPMQDGEFREGEAIHPLGKSIFVFAGGTRSSFNDFEQNLESDSFKSKPLTDDEIKKEKQRRLEQFREAKGPDFVSRLRGFINILGPNPNPQGNKPDNTFMVRRAKILRETFSTTEKTRQLFNSVGDLQIDESVLRAMLNVPFYRHGNRSMSALLDMSRLTGKNRFDLSALPTPDQLDMHVDSGLFIWLAANERFYTLLPSDDRFTLLEGCPMAWEQQLVDRIAEKMYIYNQRKYELKGDTLPDFVAWTDLQRDKKQPFLHAAADIPVKLKLVGHGIRSIVEGEPVHTPDLSDGEVDDLAKEEYERKCLEKHYQETKNGSSGNKEKKSKPDLIHWEDLCETGRNENIEAIYSIPPILQDTGFSIFRYHAWESIDENLILDIAKAIHADYCAKRKAEGQTVEKNPNLVSFKELTDDIREANIDSARTIPRKLKLLGIRLQKAQSGANHEKLELSPDEIEKLSQWEHARWNWQKIMQGWVYGPVKSEATKTHPCLLPWANLPEEIREYDRENVRQIPGFLGDAGFIAVR
jgi:hypothetical protein